MNTYEPTGVEELRALAEMSRYTREGAFDGLTVSECINLLRAVRSCPWDIYADALTLEERRFAVRHGRLSKACERRLEHDLG